MTTPTLGSRLALLREAAGLTRYKLYKESGVPATQIKRIERGEQDPTSKTIEKLAAALKVSAGELFGEGDKR